MCLELSTAKDLSPDTYRSYMAHGTCNMSTYVTEASELY